MSGNRAEICLKCGGKMTKGSAETLSDAFRCTRPESKELQKKYREKIQPYYCESCGYIEFYREKME